MRRIANLNPGQAITAAGDAFIIAYTARTMPRTLRRVDTGDDTLAELDPLIGVDDSPVKQPTSATEFGDCCPVFAPRSRESSDRV